MAEMLRREFAFRADVGDQGLVRGYASLFNARLTDCAHNEIFQPGCWSRSIHDLHTEPVSKGEPSRVSVNWGHDWGTPFAIPTLITEDAKGLYTEARVKLYGSGEVNADRWAQVRAGLVSGLSVEIDPSRSKFDLLDEVEARALGYEGDWNPYMPPRRWTSVYLLGWAYVLVPSMAGARVTEVRDARGRATCKGVKTMDEATKTEMTALIAEACKPLYERMDKIEKAMEGGGDLEEVIEQTTDEEPAEMAEEMRTLRAQVAELRAAADEATFQAWRAANAPTLAADVARHIYAAPEKVRAALLKTPPASPNLPPIGSGSGMREVSAMPKTAREAWAQIKAKHGTNCDAANAEWATVREQYRD